jgi:DNA (cytosine-5)-methyltransferase 1
MKNNIVIFSFFSGIGLLDLGFEHEDFKVVFVNEYFEPFLKAYRHSRKSLKLTSPEYGYFEESIEKLFQKQNIDKLKKQIKNERKKGNKIMFIGGPPCPDFSIGGKNKGEKGENGKLTAAYFRLITEINPDFFLFENVKGLFRTKKHREFFDSEINKLNRNKYVTKYDIFNSINFGVAQDRDRLICVGVLDTPRNLQNLKTFNLNSQVIYETKVIKEINWPQTNTFAENSKLRISDNIPIDLTVGYWFAKNAVEKHPNGGHFFTPRAALKKFKKIEEGDTSKKSFKRLHRNRYSPTAAYGNNEVHLHPFKPRRISAAEALAIQSAPKNFSLPKEMTLSNMFKSIGNAVPYLLARAIAREVKKLI